MSEFQIGKVGVFHHVDLRKLIGFFCLQSVLIFPFVLVQKSDVCWFLWLVTGEQWLNILVVCLVFFYFFGLQGIQQYILGNPSAFTPRSHEKSP